MYWQVILKHFGCYKMINGSLTFLSGLLNQLLINVFFSYERIICVKITIIYATYFLVFVYQEIVYKTL